MNIKILNKPNKQPRGGGMGWERGGRFKEGGDICTHMADSC